MENMSEIIIALFGILSSIVTWFLGRKKAAAETTSIEIESLQRVISAQSDQIDKLSARVQELTDKVFELQNEIMRLKSGCA